MLEILAYLLFYIGLFVGAITTAWLIWFLIPKLHWQSPIEIYTPVSLEEVIKHVRYRGSQFNFVGNKLCLISEVKDSETGDRIVVVSFIKVNLMDSEQKHLENMFQLIKNFEYHEAAEFFTYKGEKPFYPHATTNSKVNNS